jgi:feruloyl esterase
MKLYAASALALAVFSWSPASAAPPVPVQGVSEYLFERIVHFAKVSMATYASDSCTIPSLPRLAIFHNTTTEIYGWVLRDDSTRELIVSFRGTNATVNHVFDRNWNLTDFTPLVPSCAGCEAHAGYYEAWNSISDQVFPLVEKERKAYPHYGLIVTGHRSVVFPGFSVPALAFGSCTIPTKT